MPSFARTSWPARAAIAAAAAYVASGLGALWLLSPRVPYGDQWRHYARLLDEPFARAVLSADNGHAEIVPNLLRWLELHLLGGHEMLQIVCAGMLALATLLVLMHGVARDRTLPSHSRAAAILALAFGLFWLGNLHALTVVTDAVHVYLVLLCVVLALRLALAARVSTFALLASCALACGSFGSGFALVPALALVLGLRGAFRQLAMLAAGALLIALGYLLLPASVHDGGAVPNPLRAAQVMLQILGAPFVYLLWPLLDPAAAGAVPLPLRGIALAAANGWTAQFGEIRTSVWPQAAFGIAMLAATAHATLRAARGAANDRLGVGLAWFGIGCAVLIALARTRYFDAHPDQVYALRYLPWTCIGWSGLLLAWIARTPASRAPLLATLLLAAVALPSEFGLWRLAAHVRDVAEDTALDAAVGVLPADQPLGETQLEELQAALPALREADTAMFAWRETRQLGAAPTGRLSADPAHAEATTNLLSADGGVRLREYFSIAPCGERLLAVADGRVVGLLRPDTPDSWKGVARGTPAQHWELYTFCY